MKILFATKNPAKINMFKTILEEKGIEVLTINDLDTSLDVLENGKDALENALIKAKTYYEKYNIPTIGMDDSLFIENIDNNLQPGTYVRRVNGKTLNDEEMIEYYTNLVKKYGKKLNVYWVYGMVAYNKDKYYNYTWESEHFYFVDTPSEKRNPGYPLDSISILPKNNKYFVDLDNDEKLNKNSNLNDIINFIIESLNK